MERKRARKKERDREKEKGKIYYFLRNNQKFYLTYMYNVYYCVTISEEKKKK